MRKVELRMNELRKYEIIKKLVDTNGNKKSAALKLGCTIRSVNRLIVKYKEKGKEGFIHANRGRKPSHAINNETKETITDLYKLKYSDCNYSHFTELLADCEGIHVSDSSVRKYLLSNFQLSPKTRRKTKKRIKELSRKNLSTQKKKQIEESLQILESYDAHPRRPRAAYFGELIQMDASLHSWFGTKKTQLHAAIDDATGMIVGMYFDHEETLKGYYNVLNEILVTYGIPHKFFTDRRTVFEYKKRNAPSSEEDTFTHFSYACHQLGIEIETSSVPQAKGRIERLFNTLQSRLIPELRLAGIHNIEEANEFLKLYIKKFNERFSLPINSTKTVFEKQPSSTRINEILSIINERVIDQGHCIKYKKEYYMPLKENGNREYFTRGTKCLVIEAFDSSLFISIGERMYSLDKIEKRKELSSEFDIVSEKVVRKPYVPPMTHPWKRDSYMKFLAKQKHHISGANA